MNSLLIRRPREKARMIERESKMLKAGKESDDEGRKIKLYSSLHKVKAPAILR